MLAKLTYLPTIPELLYVSNCLTNLRLVDVNKLNMFTRAPRLAASAHVIENELDIESSLHF